MAFTDEQAARANRITTAAAAIFAGTEQAARTTQADVDQLVDFAFQLEAKVSKRIAAENNPIE